MYGGVFALVILLILAFLYFSFIYKKPTCSDGKRNGGEAGIDCGGSCRRLCQSSFLQPRLSWGGAKFEKIAPSLYNVAAYIENLNVSGGAVNVPFKVALYDNQGILIVEQEGKTHFSPHRNTLAFLPLVNVGQRIPAKATFEFLNQPSWFRSHDILNTLIIADKVYEETKTNSSLTVTFINNALTALQNVEAAVVLYDIGGNVIGFSRTFVDQISGKGGKETISFTWPISRNGKVVTIEVLPLVYPTED